MPVNLDSWRCERISSARFTRQSRDSDNQGLPLRGGLANLTARFGIRSRSCYDFAMLRYVVGCLVEFFGSLLGIPSIVDRPRHDFKGKMPTMDDFNSRR